LLVADDDAPLREALVAVLENEGHDVVQATDGRQALDRLADGRHPSAILLDWMMPVVDGESFLRARAASASLSSIPVFVLSASYRPVSDSRIQGFLQKPFNIDDLLVMLRGVCEADCADRACPPGARPTGALAGARSLSRAA